MSRATSYTAQYQHAATAAARWAEIQASIQDEVLRAQEAEAIAASERQSLAALEESFRVRPTEMSEINSILKEQNQALQASRAAGAAASQARAARMRDIQDEAFGLPAGQRLGPEMSADVIRRQLATGALTRTEAASLLSEYQRRFPGADMGALSSSLGAARYAPEESGGGDSQAAIKARTEVALDRLFLSSPQAAYGGTEAQAQMDARAKAPSGAGHPTLATQADLLGAYLEMLEDGDVSAEEWAGAIGYEDAEQARADFSAAQALYQQAKVEKSFANAQLKLFEPAWLAQARAASTAEQRAQQLRQRAPDDPRQEAMRQELIARGYDPDDPHTRYKGTPLHSYLTTADRIYGQVEGDVRPATPQQERLAEFVRQAQASGGFSLKTLEAQLQKLGLSAEQQAEAAGFALAYARASAEAKQPPDQRAMQQGFDAEKKAQEAAAKAAADKADAEASAAREKAESLSRDLQRKAALGQDAGRYYQAMRAAGASPETARMATDQAFPEFSRPTPGGPLDLAAAEAEMEAETAAQIPSVRAQFPDPAAARQLFAERMQPPAVSAAPPAVSAAVPPAPAAAPSSFEAAQADPTDPRFRYLPQPDGSYAIYRDGIPTGRAAAGTRAAQSIASVLSGGAPLKPAAPRPRPEPTLELPEIVIQGTPPTPAPTQAETPEQRLQRLLAEAAGG